jgi:hypothetical protein
VALQTIKAVTQHLRDHQWEVTKEHLHFRDYRLADFQDPLVATKRDIKIPIRCIDARIQHFMPPDQFIAILEAYSRELRIKSTQRAVCLISDSYKGLVPERLARYSVVLMTLSELSLITDLEQLYDDPSVILDDRKKIIAQGCQEFCVVLSTKCFFAQNYEAAEKWLLLAVDGLAVISAAHLKLVDLHIKLHAYGTARELCETFLNLSPSNLQLLAQLKQIELNSSNPERLREIEKRLSNASELKPTLESMLRKQNDLVRSKRHSNEENKEEASPKTFLGMLLRKIRPTH